MPTSSAGSTLSTLTFTDPHRVAGWQHARVPAVAGRELPSALHRVEVEVAGAGRSRGLEEWVEAASSSTSALVLHGGRAAPEWYADGLGPGTLFPGASMTRSVLAHLIGRAVREDALAWADPVTSQAAELAGTGHDGTTVLDRITMTTGVDWIEDHLDPGSLTTRLPGCFVPGADSRAVLREVRPAVDPGTRFGYCAADSQVLDWVRERATDAVPRRDAAAAHRTMEGGAEAHRWALVNEVLPDGAALTDRVWEVAGLLEAGPPLVFAAIKETVREAKGARFHQVLRRVTSRELQTLDTLHGSADDIEGFRALAEKRPPRWTGR